MKIIDWNKLPAEMQTEEVRAYYDILKHKRFSLWMKRAFDVVLSFIALIVSSPLFLILAIMIKLDSPGPVFFRQERVTQYGKRFRIHKFRTMIHDSENGPQITIKQDSRITRVGKMIRDSRLDEIPQLIDVLQGALTLVGVRPEIPKFVDVYTDEMMATLLLPAGVTSVASIRYKEEAQMLESVEDADKVYIEEILPQKMRYNLEGIKEFSLLADIKIIFMTILAVFGKNYDEEKEAVKNK